MATYAPLSPGEMDQIVTLQVRSDVADPFGQRVVWADLSMVYAMCEPLQGREFFAAGADQNPASLRVTIYWRPNLPSDLRVIWMGKTYELTAAPIDVGGKRQAIELMLREVAA